MFDQRSKIVLQKTLYHYWLLHIRTLTTWSHTNCNDESGRKIQNKKRLQQHSINDWTNIEHAFSGRNTNWMQKKRKIYQLLEQHPDIQFLVCVCVCVGFIFALYVKNSRETIKNNERETRWVCDSMPFFIQWSDFFSAVFVCVYRGFYFMESFYKHRHVHMQSIRKQCWDYGKYTWNHLFHI